ncbi:hypothetical protein FZC78_04550 [Rossellomorea vietnamensis]|uniref:Uncharacterized protein n=1 Tax=Rossellomorea vietnamensis TaxID=218284 RepID=A0A5D4NWQ4_9BACI|nr:hypothetical protein [Rossellomorea vietnamensis]TYS18783.1 hypothetical protein FZC78_04550 [Rossellomorea vietnamensis]
MKEKLKAFGLPLMAISVLIGILFFQQLQTLTELPNEKWSRSIPFELETEEKPIVFHKGNEIFYSEQDQVHHYSVNEGLDVKNEGDISFTVPRGYSFWTDGEQFVTLSQGVLTLNGKSEKVIAEEVTGVATVEDKVIYWQEGNVFKLDLETWESKNLHSFSNEVANVFFGSNGSYVIAEQTDDVNAELFYVTADDAVNASPFLKVANNKNNKLGNLAYTDQDGEITFIYDSQLRSQGVLSYSMYMAKASINELGNTLLKPELVQIINEANGAKLVTPRDVQFMTSTDTPTLLFTAEAQGVGAGNTVSLYTGTYDGSTTIQSSSITTTDGISHFPVEGLGNSIVWLDYKGGNYTLYGASQSPEIMAASTELNTRSWKEAGINTVWMLGSSMVTFLVSFYWILPSLLLLIVLYMTKPNIFEKEEINWVEYVSIAIFALMPFTFIDKAMNGYFYEIAPSYLTFSGSGWILLLIITAVSAVVWKFGRDPEWGTFGGAFYFIGVYIMLYITSIGTYVFNLF